MTTRTGGWPILPIEAIAARVPNALVIGPFGSDLKVSDYNEHGTPVVFVKNVKPGRFDSADMRFVSAAKAKQLAAHVVRSGDLLATKMGDPPCLSSIYPEAAPDAIITADLIKLSLDRSIAEPRFIMHFLNSPEAGTQVARFTAGVTRQKVTLRDFRSLQVPLPPLNEQRRIAEILDRADALRAKRRAALAQLDTLAQSIFLDMFGDPARNTKRLPTITLGDLGEWRSGGTPPRSRVDYFHGTVPWFSSGELDEMYVFRSKEHVSLAALRETAAKPIPEGSLMLGMYDTAALKASVAGIECSCNQAVAFAAIDRALAEPTFVYFAIVIGRDHFRRQQRGVRQKNLNLSMVRGITIPNPPVWLQREFALRMKTISETRKALHSALAQAEALFGSLQDRAFRGGL